MDHTFAVSHKLNEGVFLALWFSSSNPFIAKREFKSMDSEKFFYLYI